MSRILQVLVVVAASAFPATAGAQVPAGQPVHQTPVHQATQPQTFVPPTESSGGALDARVALHLHTGLGGSFTDDQADSEVDASTTLGGGVRYEFPLFEYATLGLAGLVSHAAPDIEMADGIIYLDLNLAPLVRFPLDLEGHRVELYAVVPVGFTLGIPEADGVDPGPGWNIGILGGARILFGQIGVFAEIGWWRHSTGHDVEVFGVEARSEPVLSQLALEVGLVFAPRAGEGS